MVRAVHVRQVEQRVAILGRAGRGLVPEDVEGHAKALLASRRFERRVVHDFGARGVHDEGATLQPGQQRGVDQPARLRPQRDMDAEDVAAGGDLAGRGRQGDV